MSNLNQPIRKILRLKQVIERIGLSRSTIYDWMNPKSKRYDSSFPTPYKLNANAKKGTGAVGWLESDIDAWIEQRFQITKYTEIKCMPHTIPYSNLTIPNTNLTN